MKSPQLDRKLRRDLKTIARFIELYCSRRHAGLTREPVVFKPNQPGAEYVDGIKLCPQCAKLLAHAFVKRSWCPMQPKPACKHCPDHCYHPQYRAQIREVMKYSGRRLVLSGRIDYLFHLLF